MKLTYNVIDLPLKVNWKISRNETFKKQNIIVRITDGGYHGLGEIAPNIRYGETVESVIKDLERLIEKNSFEIDIDDKSFHQATKMGVELALLNLDAAKNHKTLHCYLGLSPKKEFVSSYSIPIVAVDRLAEYIDLYKNFSIFKVKVSGINSVPMIQEIQKYHQGMLRIDANEGFQSSDEVLFFLEQIDSEKIEFMEQPLPATSTDEMKRLKSLSNLIYIADESITDNTNFEYLSELFDGVNIKLAKSGGIINALSMIKKAKSHDLKIMIGCMIETGLGISAAFILNEFADYIDLDGSLLIEDAPYQYIKTKEDRIYLSL